MARLLIRCEGRPAEILEVSPGRHSIGRTEDNDFQILDPSVSSRHCELDLRQDGLFIRDVASTNGTYVDAQVVEGEIRLQTGQMVRLGDVICEVHDAAPDVVIPTWSEPEAPPLPSGMKPCFNHPALPASMRCGQCGRLFCGACIHILRRTRGVIHKLCPVCSGPCQALEGMNATKSQSWLAGLLKHTFRLPRLRK
jgi:hypothetical protein